MSRARAADERGSIALMMLVMLVATGLVVSVLVVVQQGQRTSRRSGDSANALQVADAAVNDAMQAIPTAVVSPFTRSAVLGEAGWPGSCPLGKDCYTFTATKDSGPRPVWHIDAVGTDKTGVQRRIRASAVAASLFNSPLFVKSSMTLSSGVLLDSYSSGASKATMCTKKGVIGTNNPSGMQFGTVGGGGGVVNCQNWAFGNNWTYSMDGCTSYGDGTQALPPISTAQCPPEPLTFRTNTGLFQPPEVLAPPVCAGGEPAGTCANEGNGTGTMTCPSAAVPALNGGTTYFFSSVSLLDGCRITNPKRRSDGTVDLDNPVVIYASHVTIGSSGADRIINDPPAGPLDLLKSICGTATAVSSQNDSNGDPPRYYCPGWSGSLRIRIIDGVNGTIRLLGNKTRFWGAMEAPTGSLTLDGSQQRVWGAIVSNIAGSNAQFSWHFDDALTSVTTTQFVLASWREEPLA